MWRTDGCMILGAIMISLCTQSQQTNVVWFCEIWLRTWCKASKKKTTFSRPLRSVLCSSATVCVSFVSIDADVCAEAKCSNLCLPSARKPSGYTCACPDNIHGYRVTLDADQRTCRATKGERCSRKRKNGKKRKKSCFDYVWRPRWPVLLFCQLSSI